MGANADSIFKKKENMKAYLTSKFRKYGKRALIIYLCWCVLKGLFFLFIGYKFRVVG